jgi:hypothetical protein
MNEKKHFKIITILIPIIGAIIYAFKKQLVHFMFSLPPCPFYTIYNLYCPACGNTRSVNALLQGDILLSLHYNIIPILLILTLMLGYIELAFYSFGKKKKILPRSKNFYLITGSILLIYLILRNFIPLLFPSL